ncbi:hypothetical protein [Pseudomonas sp. CBC3]|uniref:hypothetical protein n=1 Tax=Pseudomonas sp. CBC3 TaxID=3123318 RepID=UPI0030EA7DEA
MSELKRQVVVIKNSVYENSVSSFSIYKRVRVEDEQGKTFYFKNLVVPDYLRSKGAIVNDRPRVWFVKNTAKNVSVIIAYETPDGQIEYDLDEIKALSKSSVMMGLKFAVAAVPASIIIATATFGFGLLLVPWIGYYAYRHLFKVPAMLSQKRLIEDFAKFGVTIRPY